MILPEHLHTKNLKIIDRYGLDHQLRQLMEEYAEAIQAISKYLRAKEGSGQAEVFLAEKEFIKETVDIDILIDQIRTRMNFDSEETYHMAAYKIDRQLGRMKK